MFLHIGADVMVPKKNIIAILEIDTNSSPINKEFLEIAKDEGFIEQVSDKEKEKSYLITTEKIYISPISCVTLKKRADIYID